MSPRATILLLAALAPLLVLTSCAKKPVEAPPPEAISVGSSASTEASDLTGKVTLYYPCGLVVPVSDVLAAFETAYPNIELDVTYDNAVTLVDRLLEKNEHADVFISAGDTELAKLEAAGRVDVARKRPFGSFDLVAVKHRDNPLTIEKPEDLLQCTTLAMPEPGTNSVGDAGVEALTSLGLWDRLKGRFVMPRQAIDSHDLVSAGKVDVALSWNACPLETNPEKMDSALVRICFAFPEGSYTEQHCWVAPMADAQSPEAAQALVDFFARPETLRILAENDIPGAEELAAGTSEEPPVQAGSGEESAPGDVITVDILYPGNEEHQFARDLADELNAKYAGKVRATFTGFGTPEGVAKLKEAGESCGTVLIDGKNTFEVADPDGGTHTAVFKRKMGSAWQKSDLYAVLDELAGAKAKVPGGADPAAESAS